MLISPRVTWTDRSKRYHVSLKNGHIGVQKVQNLGDTCPHMVTLPRGIIHVINHMDNPDHCSRSRHDIMALNFMQSTLRGSNDSWFFSATYLVIVGVVKFRSLNFTTLTPLLYPMTHNTLEVLPLI